MIRENLGSIEFTTDEETPLWVIITTLMQLQKESSEAGYTNLTVHTSFESWGNYYTLYGIRAERAVEEQKQTAWDDGPPSPGDFR